MITQTFSSMSVSGIIQMLSHSSVIQGQLSTCEALGSTPKTHHTPHTYQLLLPKDHWHMELQPQNISTEHGHSSQRTHCQVYNSRLGFKRISKNYISVFFKSAKTCLYYPLWWNIKRSPCFACLDNEVLNKYFLQLLVSWEREPVAGVTGSCQCIQRYYCVATKNCLLFFLSSLTNSPRVPIL